MENVGVVAVVLALETADEQRQLSRWIEAATVLGLQNGKLGFLPAVTILLPQDRVLELIAVDAWNLGEALRRNTQDSGSYQLEAKQYNRPDPPV